MTQLMIERSRSELTSCSTPAGDRDAGARIAARGPGARPDPPPAHQLAAVPPGRLHGPRPERRPMPAGPRPGPDHGDAGRVPAVRGRASTPGRATSSTASRTTACDRTWIRTAGPDVMATETARAAVKLIQRDPAVPAPADEQPPQRPDRPRAGPALRSPGGLRGARASSRRPGCRGWATRPPTATATSPPGRSRRP